MGLCPKPCKGSAKGTFKSGDARPLTPYIFAYAEMGSSDLNLIINRACESRLRASVNFVADALGIDGYYLVALGITGYSPSSTIPPVCTHHRQT